MLPPRRGGVLGVTLPGATVRKTDLFAPEAYSLALGPLIEDVRSLWQGQVVPVALPVQRKYLALDANPGHESQISISFSKSANSAGANILYSPKDFMMAILDGSSSPTSLTASLSRFR
jgi:hypothetical protein